MFLVGANSCWRPGTCAPSIGIGRRIGRVQVCNLNPVVCINDTQLNSHNARKYINLQVQVGTRCTVSLLEPAKATVGRPFRVAIPRACSDSCKAKALPYVLIHIKQIIAAECLI